MQLDKLIALEMACDKHTRFMFKMMPLKLSRDKMLDPRQLRNSIQGPADCAERFQ